MQVLVVGAGAQGAPCTSILARDPSVSRIVLGDIDLELADRVQSKIGGDKITTVALDAGDVDQIRAAAQGVDVIINLTHLRYNATIMEAAWRVESHYVDTATYEPFWGQIIAGGPLFLDEEFKQASRTALISCGISPGVVDVLAELVCGRLEQVDEISVKLGKRDLTEKVVKAWDPGWSLEVALRDYADEAVVYQQGRFRQLPPFSEPEVYPFPDPVGPLLVTHHSHEEPLMMARFMEKEPAYCEFKYGLDPIAGALVKMGFASEDPVEVNGEQVAPLDMLAAVAGAPVNAFLAETEKTAAEPAEQAAAIVIEMSGVESGERVDYTLTVIENPSPAERLALFKRFGTTQIRVALPAVVGAKMCVAGAPKGVIGPECLGPRDFLQGMADMGAPLEFREQRFKRVRID